MPARLKLVLWLINLGFFFFLIPIEVFAVTITINQAPSAISDSSFTVSCSISGAGAGTNYLKIDLYQEGSENYFGQTFNGVDWYSGSDGKQYFPITIVSGTVATAEVAGKIGSPLSNYYSGPGLYKLKIRRYTSSGNQASGDQQVPAEVQINVSFPTPTPTILPTPTSALTPTSSPETATYKINEVKNESGEILNSVKIYLDNHYICHYAEETLTFCGGCQHECDEVMVNYSLGEHFIKLEKTGYQNWEETKTINAGDYIEVNPVMKALTSEVTATPTPTPLPTFRASPTPTKKVTVTPIPTPTEKIATESGEILGKQEFSSEAGKEESSPSAVLKKAKLAKVLLGLGFLALFGAGFSLWYTRLKDLK